MTNSLIDKKIILEAVNRVLLEETSKVNRNDYNKVQFKIDELESQLIETIKEFRKLEFSVPDGLKTIAKNRLSTISSCLNGAYNTLKQLKGKVKDHKRLNYQQVDEKKK